MARPKHSIATQELSNVGVRHLIQGHGHGVIQAGKRGPISIDLAYLHVNIHVIMLIAAHPQGDNGVACQLRIRIKSDAEVGRISQMMRLVANLAVRFWLFQRQGSVTGIEEVSAVLCSRDRVTGLFALHYCLGWAVIKSKKRKTEPWGLFPCVGDPFAVSVEEGLQFIIIFPEINVIPYGSQCAIFKQVLDVAYILACGEPGAISYRTWPSERFQKTPGNEAA